MEEVFDLFSSFDFGILEFFKALPETSLFIRLMRVFTFLGDNGFIWFVIAGVLLCFKPTRRDGFFLLLSLFCVFLLNDIILKPIFMRVRPFIEREWDIFIPAPLGSSFPSGHSASSFACGGFLFFRNKKQGALALVLAFFIAASRVVLLVHYPTDVIIGSLLGFLVGWIVSKIEDNTAKEQQ